MWTWRRWASALAAVALGSCASVPAARRAPLEAARFALFPDADVRFALSLTPAVRLAAARLLPGSAEPLLRRADRVYGAATPAGLYAAAEGRFSPAALWLALACRSDWRRAGDDRWRAADGSLEAAAPSGGLLLLGTGDISPVIARAAAPPGFAMPPEAAAALADAVLFAWAARLPAGLAEGLPIRTAWVAFGPQSVSDGNPERNAYSPYCGR